jgi:hypothetical protein
MLKKHCLSCLKIAGRCPENAGCSQQPAAILNPNTCTFINRDVPSDVWFGGRGGGLENFGPFLSGAPLKKKFRRFSTVFLRK